MTDPDLGISETMLDRTAFSGPTISQQLFLKLYRPAQEVDYPVPRILLAERSYRFPFTFTVPSRLLPQVCEHDAQGEDVRQAHCTPPPTLGKPIMVCDAQSSLDDLTPATVGITYYLRSVLVNKSQADGHQAVSNVCQKIRIVPASRKESPLDMANYPLCRSQTEKSLRRGPWCSTRGRLSASSVQPDPIALATSGRDSYESNNTAAVVQLKFNPVGDAQPPQLGSITSTLHANTFYMSKSAHQELHHTGSTLPPVSRTLFSESVPLSTVCPASLKWKKYTLSADAMRRRSSDISDDYSDTYPGDQVWYTASVVVPIALPKSKAFVPTFHSCLVSRTYSVDVSLSYDAVVTKALSPKISLRLPIQIVTENKSIEAMQTSLYSSELHQQSDQVDLPSFTLPVYEVTTDGMKLPEYSERAAGEIS